MIDYCALARTSLQHYLTHHTPFETQERVGRAAGCFVSLHHKNGELRGCIGTIAPDKDDLAREVTANAVSAGTRDPRFLPITREELDHLDLEVSVLQETEPIEDVAELDHKRYGLILENERKRGVLLPDLDGVESVAHQIQIVQRKAGIHPTESVRMFRFEVEKHHE